MIAVAYDVTSLAENPHAGIAQVCRHTLDEAARSPVVEPLALYRHGDPAYIGPPGVATRRIGWLDRFRSARWDILHALGHRIPLVRPRRLVYTLHDVWSLYPNPYQSPEFQRRIGPRMRAELPKADMVVAVSEATRNKLLELGLIEPSRCQVVPNGVACSETVATPDTEPPAADLVPRRFVLFVGRIEVRKNLKHIVEAVRPLENLKLVVVGEPGFGGDKIIEHLAALPSTRLVHFQRLPETQLDWLYRHALAVLLPSWEEGFGLPILEAMIRGCPVITSNCSGSAEVGGKAALLVDPHEPSQSRHHLERLRDDPAYRGERVADSLVRAGQFSWGKSFELLLEVYRHVLQV